MSRFTSQRSIVLLGAGVGIAVVLAILLVGRDNGSNSTSPTTTTTAIEGAAQPVSDPAVVDLQRVMTRLGYYNGPIDGLYGNATTTAVKDMQTALGIPADGVYGPTTAAALKDKATSVTKQIQTELATYGYYKGPIDGDYGPATKEAVAALQTDLGVSADGLVGAETITAFQKAVADGTLTTPTTTTVTSTTTATTTTTTN